MAVDVSKAGQGFEKSDVGSCCAVRVIDKQGEAIGVLHQTIHNFTKRINILSTKTGGMGQDLHKMVKEMEYYAAKPH